MTHVVEDRRPRSLDEHPTVRRVRQQAPTAPTSPPVLDHHALRATCLELGADDVGFVEVERAALSDQRAAAAAILPHGRTYIALAMRMNRDSIRTPARSVANVEFHHAGDEVNEVGRRIVRHLEAQGIRAVNVTMGFPMEADRWPEAMWMISHKPVAVEAALGRKGIHRSVIHPRFGSFVLLGTVITDAAVSETSRPLDFNPCLECKLCVAACPTGAIAPDGRFDFSACYTHNYREFMGGFADWVETVADSRDRFDYRRRVSPSETVSMWQSLGFGPNYKAAYCIAVCPAGEDVIGPFLDARATYVQEIVRPLRDKAETVYVTAGSDAASHVAKHFPQKRTKTVANGLRPNSIPSFLFGLRLTFQPGRAAAVEATYHFTFTGREPRLATVRIVNGTLKVADGHDGACDLHVQADSDTWLEFLAKEAGLPRALLTRKIRLRGSWRLLLAFARCFAA